MPAAFSQWCKQFLAYSSLGTIREKGLLAPSWSCSSLYPSPEFTTKRERCISQCAEPGAVLSMLPAWSGHWCSPDRFEVPCLPPAAAHGCVTATACWLAARLPSPRVACERCSPQRPGCTQLAHHGGFSWLREGFHAYQRAYSGFVEWEALNN